MKYKIGKVRIVKSPNKKYRIIGIGYDGEFYPSVLSIFLYKWQIKISFVFTDKYNERLSRYIRKTSD